MRVVRDCPRPYLDDRILRVAGALATVPPPPPTLSPLTDTLATLVDVGALQDAVQHLLSQQYQAALASDTLRVFENVGELFIFMEGFRIEEYLAAQPQSSDIMRDMSVMLSWLASLDACSGSHRQELLFFDLEAMTAQMRDVARSATNRFLRLVRETMYDKCVELQVCHLRALDRVSRRASGLPALSLGCSSW